MAHGTLPDMLEVADVAKFFLTLSQPDEGDTVSNLKLQKLVYYAQGFSLAIFGRPMFANDILAWEHGPVVRELWESYRTHGSNGIPVPEDFDVTLLPADEQQLLVDVWNTYGQFSAWKLRNMTHEEPPWKDTPRNNVIAHSVLREYFATQVAP